MALTPHPAPTTPSISPANLLTEAHGPPASRARPELADQALAGVTGVEMVAGLPEPPCTYPAAVAAIQHQGHPQWASGWWPGAGTRCWAQLGIHLQRQRPRSAVVVQVGSETLPVSHLSVGLGSVGSTPWCQSKPALNPGGPLTLPKRQHGIRVISTDSGREFHPVLTLALIS